MLTEDSATAAMSDPTAAPATDPGPASATSANPATPAPRVMTPPAPSSAAAAAASRGERGGVATAQEIARAIAEDDVLFEKQLRERGMIPDDYPPEWLPNTGKPWFGPEYHLPPAATSPAPPDPGPASATSANPPTPAATHSDKCGNVGQTGKHGDLGSNKA